MTKLLRLEKWIDHEKAIVSFDDGSGYGEPVEVTLKQVHVLSAHENEHATVVIETQEVFYNEHGCLAVAPQPQVTGDF